MPTASAELSRRLSRSALGRWCLERDPLARRARETGGVLQGDCDPDADLVIQPQDAELPLGEAHLERHLPVRRDGEGLLSQCDPPRAARADRSEALEDRPTPEASGAVED